LKKKANKKSKLPFKFRVEINPDADGEIEIVRKRALLRLNSSRVYSQMGSAIHAHEMAAGTLSWLQRLMEISEPEDLPALEEIKAKLAPTVAALSNIRSQAIDRAVDMEELFSTAHKSARQARLNILERARIKRRNEIEALMTEAEPLSPPDTTVYNDPKELMAKLQQTFLEKGLLKKKPDEQP
jgi:hypothetical protein